MGNLDSISKVPGDISLLAKHGTDFWMKREVSW